MERLYDRCCGIDVHKKIIVACLRSGRAQEVREFGATTRELLALADWLREGGCQKIAMESTGSYWKPLYNIFEASGLDAMVVNAQHMKAVPGRKTDVKDAEWIADLLQHGLLRESYIPSKDQRELRELVSYRKSLDVILSGETFDSDKYDEMYDKKEISHCLKATKEQVIDDLNGVMTPLQRRMMRELLAHLDELGIHIRNLDEEIDNFMKPEEKQASEAIQTVTGIGNTSAQVVISVIGTDMGRFPTDAHISAWAGLCPGDNESAKKRRSGKTRKGNALLRTTLITCAHSAVRNKQSYFYAQFMRISARRGRKRAYVAVAHSMLIAIYHILKDGVVFKDLGAGYYDQFNKERKIKAYLKKLKALGWDGPIAAVAG